MPLPSSVSYEVLCNAGRSGGHLVWETDVHNDIARSAQAKGAARPPTPRARDNPLRHRSRSELIDGAEAISVCRTHELLAALLGEPPQDVDVGCQVLRPLWAEEMRHRAGRLLRLVLWMEQLCAGSRPYLSCQIELAVSRHLGMLYRSLEMQPERDLAPCSVVLREVVRDLVALFGCVAGNVEFRSDIERLALPAFQRRALVLAASELVVNTLSHAARGRQNGRLLVSLRMTGHRHARLTVTGDGTGCEINPANAERGIAGRLAALVEGDLACLPHGRAGTLAMINFPIGTPNPVSGIIFPEKPGRRMQLYRSLLNPGRQPPARVGFAG